MNAAVPRGVGSRRRPLLTMVGAAVAVGFCLTPRMSEVSARDAVVPAPMVVRDIDGRPHTPLAPAAGDIHVLFFITNDCPISNRYAPEIARIVTAYGPRRVRPFLVYAHASLPVADVRTHLRDFYGTVSVPAVLDATFALANAVGADVTPEAAVYNSTGRAYRGRIDDWYVAFGQPKKTTPRPDLRLALDAVIAGRPAPQSLTQAVGCYIERRTK